MTRANHKFFIEFRKEIMEDNTPADILEILETPCLYIPGNEPRGSMVYKDYIDLLKECKAKDAYIAELEEQLKKVQAQIPNFDKIKNDAVRELVEQLIVYAEAEEKKVAREIRIALTTKMANGYLASNVLTKEWKQRLSDLGRKSETMNFNQPVGTVVAHADHVTLQYKENE